MKRLEGIASILRSTATGSTLYSALDTRSEIINIEIASEIRGTGNQSALGVTKVTKIEDKKATEITIKIDANSANSNYRNTELVGDQGAATTMAHELGHAEAAVTNLRQYTKEATPKGQKTVFGDMGTGNAEEVQAEPYENAVRKELLEKNKEEKDEN